MSGGNCGTRAVAAAVAAAGAPLEGVAAQWGGTPAGAIAAGIVGGEAAKVAGGKFEDGFSTAALQYLVTPHPSQQGKAVLDLVGKAWNLPNTIVGLIYGALGDVAGWIGYAFGWQPDAPSFQLGNNAIQFTNNPFVLPETALTLGNVEIYGRDDDPKKYGAYGDPDVNIGLHEQAHTLQGQVLGIFFGPAYVLAGPFGDLRNPYENAANAYGAGRGSWWPW